MIARHAPVIRMRPAKRRDRFVLFATAHNLDYCRGCGCTEITACKGSLGGCYWVEPNLCSSCAPQNHPGLIRFADGRVIR